MIVLCALVRLVLSYLNLLNSDELFTTLHKITESCEISDFSKFCATEKSEKTMLGTKEQPGTNFSHSLQFSSRQYPFLTFLSHKILYQRLNFNFSKKLS